MDAKGNLPKSGIAMIAIVLWMVGLGCLFLGGSETPILPTGQNSSPTAPQPTLANGWKMSKDAGGKCQVATPPDWQPGRDFFLEAESSDPGPFVNKPGQFPPMGTALWGGDKGSQLPKGKQFQMRTSLVSGDRVCSVWRIKQSIDFTAAEKSEMEQVAKTLQEVQ
jgi:hypothetical protein